MIFSQQILFLCNKCILKHFFPQNINLQKLLVFDSQLRLCFLLQTNEGRRMTNVPQETYPEDINAAYIFFYQTQ